MKFIVLVPFLITLFGCSFDALEAASSSNAEANKILEMGLSHKENLLEAKKLKDPHKVSVVTGQLITAENQKITEKKDAIEVTKFAGNVVYKNGKYTASIISNAKTMGLLVEPDNLEFYLEGEKNLNTSEIKHHLKISIKYTSKERRSYLFANTCDKWQGCSIGKSLELEKESTLASNCSSMSCSYTEKMKVNLNDDVINSILEESFSISVKSNKISNKVTLPSNYIKGYLTAISY